MNLSAARSSVTRRVTARSSTTASTSPSGTSSRAITATASRFRWTTSALGAPIDGVRFINVMGGFVEPGTTLPGAVPDVAPEGHQLREWGRHGDPDAGGADGWDGDGVAEPRWWWGGRSARRHRPRHTMPSSDGACSTTSPRRSSARTSSALAKSVDGFTSWGPWIRRDLSRGARPRRTRDHGDRERHQVQSGNTKYFAFTPSEMISHVSSSLACFPATS